MKVGLFVTGHFRGAPKTRNNYAQFLDGGHDTSVFVGTWRNRDINRYNHSINWEPVDIEAGVREAFGNNLKGLWVGDFEKFMNGEPPATGYPKRKLWNDYIPADQDPLRDHYPNPQRSLDQWYGVLRTYELAGDAYDSFDVVIRIRADQIFLGKPPIPFDDIRDGIHVNGYTWWHNPQDRGNGKLVDSSGIVPYALSDQLAWGAPKWMRKYFEYYNHFALLWAGKINVWDGGPIPASAPNSFLYNTEHMMAYYLLHYPYYGYTAEIDMPWHRHGHDDNPANRFDSDYYTWGN